MNRWHLVALAVGSLAALAACSSGDGVPTATIENGFRDDTCIVEASFLGYGFTDPILPSGRMKEREVTKGSAVAYAITSDPIDGSCYPTAQERWESMKKRQENPKLWVTKEKYTADAGKTTRIQFSAETAVEIPECIVDEAGTTIPNPEFGVVPRSLFGRLDAPACGPTP